MFLRCKVRRKDGKQHRYWSVVENTRVAGGRVVQRHVLYLGEINDTQELAFLSCITHLTFSALSVNSIDEHSLHQLLQRDYSRRGKGFIP